MKKSDIFVENLVNKKLLLAAFYHLTYQHHSKDFNICNYISINAPVYREEIICNVIDNSNIAWISISVATIK